MTVFELICIVVGAILLIIGLVKSITALIIVGIILLAIGGVLLIFFDLDLFS